MFWDVAVCSLIERRSAHAVFGEFTRKFARAAAAAPFLADPAVTQCDPRAVVLPAPEDTDVVAWAQNETSTGAAAPVERIGDGLVLMTPRRRRVGWPPTYHARTSTTSPRRRTSPRTGVCGWHSAPRPRWNAQNGSPPRAVGSRNRSLDRKSVV